jgi:fumarate hydratase, class I
VVDDPLFARRNTRDNTPAVLHVELVPGDTVDVTVAAKGGASENKSKFVMLNPSDSLTDWVLRTVPTMGAGWCPPGMLGIGVGGTAEKAMLLAKESLMDPIDMHELLERGPRDPLEKLRVELFEKVNALGIGAQGLGGLTTVLDIKIKSYPTHAASKPVAMIPNCAATRHAHFVLDGTGAVALDPPPPEAWPRVTWSAGAASRRVDLDALTREEVASWEAWRDAAPERPDAHGTRRRAQAHRRPLRLGRGPAGRCRFYKPRHLLRRTGGPRAGRGGGPRGSDHRDSDGQVHGPHVERTGLLAMLGKAERGPTAIESIRRHGAAYLMAVGGAAYLVSKAVRSARVVAFSDLGMEAIYEFVVRDMPVTVAVDARGESVHSTGPAEWSSRIRTLGIPVRVA